MTEGEVTGSDTARAPDHPLRLGLIGLGKRGEELLENLNSLSAGEDPDIEIRSICDINSIRLDKGLSLAGSGVKTYKNHLDMLDNGDHDAVLIATPDHWHARMAMDAADRGLHIYLEKCMSRTLEEAKSLRDSVHKNAVVFQLGHQGRQHDLNHKARELISRDILGNISLIETTTNLNAPVEGWEQEQGREPDRDSIDWDLFEGNLDAKHPFSIERYYGWRNYWDYGTGMAGDFLSDDYDAVNYILELGIPHSVIATGGKYSHLKGREVPDVFQAAFEYPERKFTLLYSGTLSSGTPRGTLIMGNDACLELGAILSVWADRQSIRYRSRIEAGMLDPRTPLVNYDKEENRVDAISSATSKYYADRGLIHTYREGQRENTSRLHLLEWLQCIRREESPSCNVDRGFEEAVTVYMANRSFLEGKKLYWDPESETIA